MGLNQSIISLSKIINHKGKELDDLVSIARDNGALGAKMTGTGRGGNMIAIASDEASRNKIAAALERGGAAFVIKTSFGA